MLEFIDAWSSKAGIPARVFCGWLGIRASKLSVWRTRAGIPNAHSPFVPREDCLTRREIDAIVDFYRNHPFDGYRRCTYMMMDADVAVASPSTVYSVLRRAGVMRPRHARRGCKGTGFHQPDAPHRHWHTDITHVKVNGVPANLCSILDGYSRFILAHRLSEDGKALDVELVFQMAVERFPEARGRMISDNGKQFVCREYRELLAQHGFIYSNTSPYYPQSNGKLEKFHGSLKNELPGGREMTGFEYAEHLIDRLVDYYNEVRLHSAIGYVTPRDMLEGRAPAIQAERERKLKDARERRRLANRENRCMLETRRETEDGSAGEQPSRDGDVTERRWPCRRVKPPVVPKMSGLRRLCHA